MKRLRFLLLLVVLLLAGGCCCVDESRLVDRNQDTQPWNSRAAWEDTMIGVPY